MNLKYFLKIKRFKKIIFVINENKISYNYCNEVVRKQDYENYLCSLVLPSGIMKVSLALRCLNIELSNIIDHTSSPEKAKLRFKFWENQLKLLFDDNIINSAPPLINELKQSNISNSSLAKIWVNRLFKARMKMVYEKPFNSMNDAEQYFEDVNSSVFYILSDYAKLASLEIDHALNHLGKCQGFITLIRGLPILAHYRKKVIIPNDLMAEVGLSHSAILQSISSKNSDDLLLNDLIYKLACSAKDQAVITLSIYSKIKSNSYLARHLCSPVILALKYLEKLEKADFNIFDHHLYQNDPLLPWHLFWNVKVRRKLS